MKIINLSENEAKDYIADVPYIHISIRSPKTEPIILPDNPLRKADLFLAFYDLDKKYREYEIFTIFQAQQILLLTMAYVDDIDLIVVNCEAGISRSAGVAGALSKIINGDDSAYFKHSLPNMLVYRTILEEHFK